FPPFLADSEPESLDNVSGLKMLHLVDVLVSDEQLSPKVFRKMRILIMPVFCFRLLMSLL
ncbi:MAG: hypothetical protein PWK00_01075, partial [Coxiella burnetii]|nr:hypothetical protein [Coxiella burnetii]